MNEILIIPHPTLRKKSLPLDKVEKEDVKLSEKMMTIMKEAPGVGLAAPQLGELKSIITIKFKDHKLEKDISYPLFNPEITWRSKNEVLMEEGCLSIPKQFVEIKRSEKIRVKYINASNRVIEKEADGYEARIIQHEVDHLYGKLFIDYLTPLKRNIITRRVKKLKKIGEI